MSRRKRAVLEMGHDSFLDIIANLVGILIILVVILGARSREVAEEAVRESATASAEAVELRKTIQRADAVAENVLQLNRDLTGYNVELLSRRQERAVLMDLLATAREQWEKKQATLSDAERQAAALAAEAAKREKELTDLLGQQQRLEGEKDPVVTLEHLPSPMAKTVFGEEIHMRLEAGRLSVVPIELLIEAIREDFRRAAGGARSGTSESLVGPIRGYTARYEMERSRTTVNRGGSVGLATRLELVSMTIEPTPGLVAEPVEEVLRSERSLLDIELAGREPTTTTVTVWVYPDSFAEFRQIKEHLYKRGIATAARPLPKGHPISGGPQGSRSAAQ
ncbi:hypothetical protein [Candidatus Laterigemmans baculatus]|uniref:hypothetical protein n=1 Tax=Candidatus Laterigemmans baculatus TaxID=2770505 RepID=UPI0013DD12E6|nr:hypothetical protein [Candidatus Laterigemmans baculatus]